jgi:hypothetical protein
MHTRLAVDRLIASKHLEDAGDCGLDWVFTRAE